MRLAGDPRRKGSWWTGLLSTDVALPSIRYVICAGSRSIDCHVWHAPDASRVKAQTLMGLMIELEARHSHFYPGATGTIVACPDVPIEGPSDQPVSIVFADGAVAAATIGPDREGRLLLDVAGYSTAAGTLIAPKRWIVAADKLAAGEDFRVLHRAGTVV